MLKYSAGFGINLLSLFSKDFRRFKILDKEQDILKELNENDKKIYQDHKRFNCINFIVKDDIKKINTLYFLIKKKKRYNFNVFDICYVSDLEQCKRYAPEICTKICFIYKGLFIGQIYNNDKEKIKFNPNFMIKTIQKPFPLKKYDDKEFLDYLYSDQITFDN